MLPAELPTLAPRAAHAHKGDFGRISIVGGCHTMAGAPALAALAALRSGAGVVQVACPAVIQSVVMGLVPCATTCATEDYQAFRPTVIAVGPGWGPGRRDDLATLLALWSGPMVIDADGLNALAEIPKWWDAARRGWVLTPHAGELRRLLAPTAIDPTGSRAAVAGELARLTGGVVVLKGHGTVVASGADSYLNDTGNPGMATAGTGDVLTGIIAALLGQGLDPFAAACLGVHGHGAAGDRAARRLGVIGMIATDLIDELPAVWREYHPV